MAATDSATLWLAFEKTDNIHSYSSRLVLVSNFAADLRDVRLADRKTAVDSRRHVNGGKDFVVDRTNTNVFIGSAERELLRSLS